MPLGIVRLEDLKDYVTDNPQAQVFYLRKDRSFRVLAGRVSWSGELATDEEARELEAWLRSKQAIPIKGWVELEELFR